jgi:hypothetical protein
MSHDHKTIKSNSVTQQTVLPVTETSECARNIQHDKWYLVRMNKYVPEPEHYSLSSSLH